MVGGRLYECGQCALYRPFLRRACGLVRGNGIWEMGHDDVDGRGQDGDSADYRKKDAVRRGIYSAAVQAKSSGVHISFPCRLFCGRAHEWRYAKGSPVSSSGLQACIQSDGRALRVPLPRIAIRTKWKKMRWPCTRKPSFHKLILETYHIERSISSYGLLYETKMSWLPAAAGR